MRALVYESEEGQRRQLTYAQLRAEVNKAANGLRSLGLGKGDVIGVYMPMTAECVIAMLAIIKIGGIFLPLFSGFAAKAVASRLADADAKALFTQTSFPRRGKTVDMITVALEAAADVPTLKHIIVCARREGEAPAEPGVPKNPARREPRPPVVAPSHMRGTS